MIFHSYGANSSNLSRRANFFTLYREFFYSLSWSEFFDFVSWKKYFHLQLKSESTFHVTVKNSGYAKKQKDRLKRITLIVVSSCRCCVKSTLHRQCLQNFSNRV